MFFLGRVTFFFVEEGGCFGEGGVIFGGRRRGGLSFCWEVGVLFSGRLLFFMEGREGDFGFLLGGEASGHFFLQEGGRRGDFLFFEGRGCFQGGEAQEG